MTTRNDTAVSDLVAAMALVAVLVTAAAIAGVALLSSPPGDAAPAMLARSMAGDGSLSIRHDGGDPLARGHFAIIVDGVDRTADFNLADASGNEHGAWTSWETGEVLVLSDADLPGNPRIQIVAGGVGRTGTTWLLHDIGNGSAVGPTMPTATPTTEPTWIPPVAGFTADPTSGSAPLTVQFTETSAGEATWWSWTFGDGGTSTARNPAHTYAAVGNYTVTLTVGNARESDTVTKTGYIIVTEEHVSRLEVDSVAQVRILFWWWDIRVNDIEIDYAGDTGAGSDTTPFVLSRTDSDDSGFNVTLTAPDSVRVWFWSRPFDDWQVGDTQHESRTIGIPVADDESRTATAYYRI